MQINHLLYKYTIAASLIVGAFTSCNKFVDVPLPSSQISGENAFADDQKANSSIRGIYASTAPAWSTNTMFQGGWSGYMGLYADELKFVSGDADKQSFLDNNLTSNSGAVSSFWATLYNLLYQTNVAIEKLQSAKGVTAATKASLTGEARFLRAFFFFYLVNGWGDVPMPLASDYQQNRLLPRTPADKVWAQIITDLTAAQQEAGEQYTAAGNRIRANKWAATALLARAQLYQKNWAEAEKQASAVIDSKLYSLDALNNVFLASSKEAILQFSNPGTNPYTMEAYFMIGNTTNPVYRCSSWLNQAFEPGDKRVSNWTLQVSNGDTAFYKYKTLASSGSSVKEALMILRLGEQYLIRAEARARQNKLASAIADVDSIRSRAGLPLISDTQPNISQENLLKVINKERMTELFGELGHRWLDVKRTGQADALYSVRKSNWRPEAILLPIPFNEMQRNPNLTQNKGYE